MLLCLVMIFTVYVTIITYSISLYIGGHGPASPQDMYVWSLSAKSFPLRMWRYYNNTFAYTAVFPPAKQSPSSEV